MASDAGRPAGMTVAAGVPSAAPQSVDDVCTAVRDALAHDEPLRIVGAQTWRGAGAPVDAARTLSMASLAGIIAYVPGDLTLTAWAGTSLAELSHATAAHGQWLGLDPAGARDGTIGATISTASAGPLAHAFGTPRDVVLGLDAVTGYGDAIRPGGRVVKNVAGFDLVRLFTGSWGTLGVITAVTLRLRALPVHDVTLAIDVDDESHLTRLVAALRRNTLSLLACEWLDGDTARQLGAGSGSGVILVRLGGSDAFITGQRAVLDAMASTRPLDPTVWGAIAALDRDASVVMRLSGPVSTLPQRIGRVRASLATDVRFALHSTLSRGVVRVIVSGDADAARVALQPRDPEPHRVVERLPAGWWNAESDPFTSGLSGRIRTAFDPQHICNRRADRA